MTPRRTLRNLWLMRAGIAAVAGVVVGLGGGLIGLRVLAGDAPPPPVVQPAAPEPEEPAARRTYRGPRADGSRRDQPPVGGVSGEPSSDSVAVVPDLIGRAEGDARRLIERAGFTLGSILFREADERLGTVLESFPVPGERVQLPATVNLILAERRRVVDTSLFQFPDDTVTTDTTFALPDSLR